MSSNVLDSYELKYLILILSFFSVITFQPGKKYNQHYNEELLIQAEISYSAVKSEILRIKSNASIQLLSEDSLSSIVTGLLVDKLTPHWLDTPWSFEGHTSVPRQGEIACGYFVSTTLQDVGFNLNRYKLAQQSPVNEAKSLSLGKPLLEINSNSTSDRIDKLKATLKEGIYFIGFDQSHVGYIQKKNGRLFLIHSNYINAEGVVIEQVENSIVFASYSKIYIAEISTNRELMKKWLLNEVIVIVNH